jgi:uncharacterized protein involved in exopolysaccharide biosynthesis
MKEIIELTSEHRELPHRLTAIEWADIRDFTRRYLWVILTVFLMVPVGTYTVLQFVSDKYDTTASLLVKLGRENVDPPPGARNTNVYSAGLRREEVISETEFLKSPFLISRVVDAIGTDAFKPVRKPPETFIGRVKAFAKSGARYMKTQYDETLYALHLKKRLSDRENAILEIENSLTATNTKDTDVIVLQLRTGDPELGKRILTTLLENYFQLRIEVRQQRGVSDFLGDETAKLKARLEDIERVKESWKTRTNLSSANEQRTLLLGQIRELETERDTTAREVLAAKNQVDELEGMLAKAPETISHSRQEVPSAASQALTQRLAVLQAERAQLSNKYQPNSAAMQNINQEISRVRQLIAEENPMETGAVTLQVNPLWQDLKRRLQDVRVHLAGLQSREQLQHDQLASLQQELRSVDSAGAKLEGLERERQIAEASYLTIVKRKEEADISEQLDLSRISNISVLTPPVSTVEPVYPRKLFLMGISIGVGLLLGIGLAFSLHYMDDRVHTARAVEETVQLPCLGVVHA